MYKSVFLWSEDVVEEVLEEDCDHGMWSDSHIIGWKTCPKSEHSLVFYWLCEAVKKAWIWQDAIFVLFHSHELCLNIVERKGNQWDWNTWNGWSSESNGHSFLFFAWEFEKLLFGLIIRDKLRAVDSHGSANSWYSTSPQSSDTLFFSDSGQGIQDILIVSSFGRWQAIIRLETD